MDRIKLAYVGTGGIAGRHAANANARDDVQSVGLMDVNAEGMAKFNDRFFADAKAAPQTFDDEAELYAKTKPDAVVICTPHTLHYGNICKALDAGCHVLIEKPMVTSLDHALDLEQRVKASGKTLCIAYNTPCTIEFYTLRQMIRNGDLGDLKLVSIFISQPWMYLVSGWRLDPKLSGGGQIYDSGAHVLNSLVWTVEADVEQVHAFVDNCGLDVDVNGTMNVRFVNGVMAAVVVSGVSPHGSYGSWMFEHGRVDADPWSGTWIQIHERRDGREFKHKYPKMLGSDSTPLNNFIDTIQGKAEPRTSVRNGILQSQLMDAVYESARTGQPARPKA